MLILTGGRIGIVKAYIAVFSPPPFGTFWVYPPPGGKRYGYHGWPLGQLAPAVLLCLELVLDAQTLQSFKKVRVEKKSSNISRQSVVGFTYEY